MCYHVGGPVGDGWANAVNGIQSPVLVQMSKTFDTNQSCDTGTATLRRAIRMGRTNNLVCKQVMNYVGLEVMDERTYFMECRISSNNDLILSMITFCFSKWSVAGVGAA